MRSWPTGKIGADRISLAADRSSKLGFGMKEAMVAVAKTTLADGKKGDGGCDWYLGRKEMRLRGRRWPMGEEMRLRQEFRKREEGRQGFGKTGRGKTGVWEDCRSGGKREEGRGLAKGKREEGITHRSGATRAKDKGGEDLGPYRSRSRNGKAKMLNAG
ncbi:hypothetical protein ACLOJK_028918 [Asimina triloba]